MISKIVAFKSSDGQTFETLEQVQQHEIELLLAIPNAIANQVFDITYAAKSIVACREKVIDILSTKGNSRPAARKANGAVRKKRGSLLIPKNSVERAAQKEQDESHTKTTQLNSVTK